jgi:hypothetical protein
MVGARLSFLASNLGTPSAKQLPVKPASTQKRKSFFRTEKNVPPETDPLFKVI